MVDFGHYIAGPLAALLLAEAGADVVHVDPPRSAAAMGPLDAWVNRSKRRITLDLKGDADHSTACDLVRKADVVIENFRPGVMERLGLGADELRSDDERLVYCSLPGFASNDEKAPVRAWEGIVHAAVAGYRPLEQHWDPSGRNKATVSDPSAPLFTPITTASNFGGLMGAVSVVMALIARERSGRGQRIEVPLAEAFAEAYSTMLSHRVYENPLMGDGLMLRDLTYRCSDGGIVDLSPYPKFVIPLLVEAGVAAEWEGQGLIDVSARSFDLGKRDRIMDMFAELVRSRPASWWDETATRAQMPVSMARTPAQWMATDHAAESGNAVTVDDPLLGTLLMPGRGFDMTDNPPLLSARHRADEDRTEILAELNASPTRDTGGMREPDSVELPLEGYTAVDVTQAVAGPTAARLLADFGADVIKVGNPVPAVTDGIIGQLHRGKRTILMDLRSGAGSRLMDELLRDSDVLVTNFTPKSRERYGIDYQRIHALKPSLVYCTITAYGQTGPWAERRGYENQCNAATGMSWRYGSRFGWTLYQPTPINDADTGILGAFAVAVALYARTQGASGQKVAASLAQGSTLHQAVHLVGEAASPDGGPDVARNEFGMNALYRFYKCSDRWIFLAAQEEDLPALLSAAGAQESADDSSWQDPGGPLSEMLAARFVEQPAEVWVSHLADAGIAAHLAASIDEAVEYLAGRGVVYFETGLDGKEVARPGIGAWLSETPPRVGPNPGAVGSQAVEILEQLGLSDEAIADLARADVVCLPDGLPQVAVWT